jgi:ribonuclease HI
MQANTIVDKTTTIYCDGSFSPNTGMGCGVYILNSKSTYNCKKFKPDDTQASAPRAELYAIYIAIYEASLVEGPVTIYSDNEYAVKTFNIYYPNWINRGMTKSSGKSPKHLDLITPMYEYFASQNGRIIIQHVYGHQGIEGNEKADTLAKAACSLTPGTTLETME